MARVIRNGVGVSGRGMLRAMVLRASLSLCISSLSLLAIRQSLRFSCIALFDQLPSFWPCTGGAEQQEPGGADDHVPLHIWGVRGGGG